MLSAAQYSQVIRIFDMFTTCYKTFSDHHRNNFVHNIQSLFIMLCYGCYLLKVREKLIQLKCYDIQYAAERTNVLKQSCLVRLTFLGRLRGDFKQKLYDRKQILITSKCMQHKIICCVSKLGYIVHSSGNCGFQKIIIYLVRGYFNSRMQ